MKQLKSFFATLVLLLSCISASAHDFYVDGIFYDITDNEKLTVEVTYQGSSYDSYSNEYTGSVVIPESVTYGSKTYSVTSIGRSAFDGCSSLTSVTIPEGVTSIGAYAFDGTAWYNNQPDGVVYAGKVAYKYKGTMPSNTSIELAEGTLGIAGYAFYECSSLTSVTIPNSVTSIGYSAFEGCSSLTSVTIPEGVTSIGSSAFSYCSSLTSVIIPNSVTSIGYRTFSGCTSLTSVTIPDGVTSIGGSAFRGCSSLTSVIIPDGVTSIGDYAFSGCSNLTSVTIPDGVTSIGYEAFDGCSSLTSVIIPNSVTSLGPVVFGSCYGLESVKVLAETPPFAYDNTFSNYYKIELCVPEKSVEAYQKTNPWSKFKTFKNLTGDDFEVKVCATPTIAYVNGKISFASETEGVEFVSSITDSDIKNYSTADIELTVTYNISVYATKSDYKDSEVAKATLCWIDVEPKSEGLTNTDIANVKALPVVVQASNGTITVTGADDGTMVEVYGISGTKLGEAKTALNTATIRTDAQTGSVVIVKVGNKSIKIRI
ncbi:MAG: leucine-rich repeat domain-containing protein [Prevotella sp.]|nr:leucine-rich repeat domain-containing protein [Prevotella sp.]